MTSKTVLVAWICAAALLVACSCALAQIPQKMNYQVMLTDDTDQPLADQTVEMVFSIWDEGVSVLPLWTETQNVTTNSIGVVSVILGSVNPIDIDFDVPLWLEVEVDGEVLSPRREIVGAPYALTDESGVASIQAAGDIHLTLSNITSVAARTMTEVPADGFVFVMATAQLTFVNSPVRAHTAKFGVSEFQNAWSAHAQEARILMPDGLPEGYYGHHVAVSGLFAVSEGSNTFYLNAQEIAGNCVVRARQLTLMYFPTSYGTVDTTNEPAGPFRSH